jgi:hypothetical protein
MEPMSPIVPGAKLRETVYAKNQPPYKPLPVFKDETGTTLSRWHLGWRERLTVLFRGDVYLWIETFNKPLQPVMLQIERPEM